MRDNKNGIFNTLNSVKKPFWHFPALGAYWEEKGDQCLPKGEHRVLCRFWRAGCEGKDRAGKMPALQKPREKS